MREAFDRWVFETTGYPVASSNFFYFAGFAPEKPSAIVSRELVREVFLASSENGPENMTQRQTFMHH
jgi:hypothetical protein